MGAGSLSKQHEEMAPAERIRLQRPHLDADFASLAARAYADAFFQDRLVSFLGLMNGGAQFEGQTLARHLEKPEAGNSRHRVKVGAGVAVELDDFQIAVHDHAGGV